MAKVNSNLFVTGIGTVCKKTTTIFSADYVIPMHKPAAVY